MSIQEPLRIGGGPEPDHADGRRGPYKRVPYSHTDCGVLTGWRRELVLCKAVVLLEAQFKAQWLRWRFPDEQCERLVGEEQERRECEEAERSAIEALALARANFRRGKRGPKPGGARGAIRRESETHSKFEKPICEGEQK